MKDCHCFKDHVPELIRRNQELKFKNEAGSNAKYDMAKSRDDI